MTTNTLRVAIFRPGEQVIFETISEDLDVLQQTVGGYIEMLSISPDDLVLTCNEEGKLMGLQVNRYLIGPGGSDTVVGPVLVSRRKGPELASIKTEDEDRLRMWEPKTVWNVAKGERDIWI